MEVKMNKKEPRLDIWATYTDFYRLSQSLLVR